MTQVTIEYMILIPVLILQIFLFPFTASVIMEAWSDSRMTLELQQTGGQLATSIQQLYYTLNHGSISDGVMQLNLEIPATIENHIYTVTLTHVTDSASSCQIMNITLSLTGTKSTSSTIVTLGNNVDWPANLAFSSANTSLVLVAEKTTDSIWISMQGGT